MRNLKRALSLALASVMLLGMMVVGTSAASYPDVVPENNTEAIAVLNAVGAMIGDENGNFNPDTPVTRNQMAAVVARLLLGPDAEDYAGAVPFTDVPEWAVKYVAACYDNGIVTGRDETTFDGDGTVTAQEAGVMMLRALGYENITDTGADWAKRAVAKAGEISLFKGVTGNVTATLTRNDIAQLSLNTLKSTCVIADVERDIVVEGVVTIPGKVTYTERKATENDSEIADKLGSAGTIELGEKLYDGKLELIPSDDDSAPVDDMGRPASVWTYDGGDPVYTVSKKANYTVTLEKALSKDDKTKELLDLAKKGLGDNSAKVFVNGADKSGNTAYTVANADLGAGDVVEMYLGTETNKDKVTQIFVTRYVLDQITDVDDDVSDDDAEDGVSCYVDFDDYKNKVNNTDIPGFDAGTYVKDAYVALLINDKGDIVDSYIPEIVEGSIETNKDNKELTIGSDKYTVSRAYTVVGDVVTVASVEKGDESTYALYLDKNGYILGITEIEVETTSINDVYYLDSVWKETGKMNSVSYYAQLVALDGTVSEVELEETEHDFGADSQLPTDLSDEEYNAVTANAENNVEGKAAYEDLTALLVTITDNKGEADSKKGDKKYNLNVWGPTNEDEDEDWAVASADSLTEIKKDDRNLEDSEIRLNKDTVYLFAEKSGQSLGVTRYVGGVAFKGTDSDGQSTVSKVYVITENGETLAKYVVIATSDAGLETEFSSDLIFINSPSSVRGKGYRSQEVYLPDGTKETWKIADSEYGPNKPATGFYAYSENDDGYYELDDDLKMKVTFSEQVTKVDWQKDKPAGVLNGVIFAKGTDLFEGMLTVIVPEAEAENEPEGNEGNESTPNTIVDITVDGADFKDLHKTDDEDQYDKTLKDIDALAKAMKDGKAGEATLYLNVSKDGAVSIFVTEVAAVVDNSGNGGDDNGDGEDGDDVSLTLPDNTTVTFEADTDNQASWSATMTGDATNGWAITLERSETGALDDITATTVEVVLTNVSEEKFEGTLTNGGDDSKASISVAVGADKVTGAKTIGGIVVTIPEGE